MTLLWIDGIDSHMSEYIWSASGGMSYRDGEGRFGGSCISGNYTSTGWVRRTLAVSDESDTLIVGMAFYGDRTGGDTYLATIRLMSDAAATTHLTFGFYNDGTTAGYVKRGDTSGTLISNFTAIPYHSWTYIEVKAKLHDSTGTWEVRYNGNVIGSGSSVDTKNGGTKTTFDTVYIGFGGDGNDQCKIDDIYVCNNAGSVNNDFHGDCRIEALYPNGNGTSSQFTGSDGNSTDNYLLVDEAGAPGTADYVQDNVAGHRDTYALANLTTTTGTVYGVQGVHYVAKSDAGTVSVKPAILSSSSLAYGSTLSPGTTYAGLTQLAETDPATATAWTISGVNAAECGVEIV